MAAQLKLVASTASYPRIKETTRPFRLWDATTNKALPWRCYKYKENAHNGALIEARWAKVSVVIEVIDIRHGKLLGQYRRTPTTIEFTEA